MSVPTREKAWELLTTYVNDEALLLHARQVEGVMRYFALELGHDVEYWGAIGLLHDIDYQQWPEEHCIKCREILKSHDIPDEMIKSIVSHGSQIVQTDVQPEEEMEKILFAIDEMTGLIYANSLVRPSKSTLDMDAKSVRKKFKQKSFAAGCNRETMQTGADMLGWSVDELIERTLLAMQDFEKSIK